MLFKSDRQRRAIFANMSHRFSSRPEIHADPALFKNVKKEDLHFLDYPEEVCKLRDKRKPGVVRATHSNFAAKPIADIEVYNLYESGIPIPEVAKAFGISVSSVKSILASYAVDSAVVGYNRSDYVEYLREIEGLDIDNADGGRIVNYLNGKDYDSLDLLLSRLRNKKKGFVRDDDERSEDYVSKGDWYVSDNRYSKKNSNFTETIDGYECNFCGEEFGSKVGARIHASACDEKDLQDDLDGDDDSGKDAFFNGDDGDPTN